MANSNYNFLPDEVRKEIDSESNGKGHLKSVNRLTSVQTSDLTENSVTIGSSQSGSVFLARGIKSGLTFDSITGGSTVVFNNFGSSNGTFTLSSIYEHVRGYVYRDFGTSGVQKWNSYLASSAGTAGLVFSKSTGAGTTGIRIISFNRSVYRDRIKPYTLRITAKPVNVTASAFSGLDFNNDDNTDATTTAFLAAVTGQAGLTGSLSAGVSGSVLTGFTVLLRIKPTNAGPNWQTILARRSGDPSQSALNYSVAAPGVSNVVVSQNYRSLYPLFASTNYSTLTFNNDDLSDFSSISGLTGGTSSVIKLTNSGGGILRWSVSSDQSWLKFRIAQSVSSFDFATSGSITSWYNSDGTLISTSGSSGSDTIAWANWPSGDMAAGHIWAGQANRQGTNKALYHKFIPPAGISGMIVYFDLVVSGDANNTTPKLVTVVSTGPTPPAGGYSSPTWSISTFEDSMTGTVNKVRKAYHVDMIPFAPRKEWKQGQTAWVGFEISAGSGKNWHIDNLVVEWVPSTIYGLTNLLSSTATITSWLDSSVTSSDGWSDRYKTGNLTIFSRPKNLENSPNLPITIPHRMYDGQLIWSL